MGLFYSVNIFFLYVCYIVVISPTIQSQKKSFSGVQTKSNNLNECERCKALTDSFTHWLDKTSRGNHEGGDVAWEEAKLKSYARSEMRLVEIQESLCSELKNDKDSCYALAEETEQLVDAWWFHTDRNTLDLYTWLCIENLKHCCPENHYGELCSPCPRGEDNKICSGNGQCDGDGTRKGKGTCKCKHGFAGSNCNQCSRNFYKISTETCKRCHRACDECHGEGVGACEKCSGGWEMLYGTCVDVDECLDSSVCKVNEYCVNNEGSYRCQSCDKSCETCSGPGLFNCTSCKTNDVLWIGRCMSETKQQEIIRNICIRIIFYFFLVLVTIFLFSQTKYFGAFMALIVSVVIYYCEKSEEIGLVYTMMQNYKELHMYDAML